MIKNTEKKNFIKDDINEEYFEDSSNFLDHISISSKHNLLGSRYFDEGLSDIDLENKSHNNFTFKDSPVPSILKSKSSKLKH